MTITVFGGRVLRVLSVLSGGVGAVLLLGAAGLPSPPGDTPARTPVVAGLSAIASGGTWGQAKEVAGNLNAGGSAVIYSVSCAAAGNCSAGGQYVNNSNQLRAFVVNQTNGIWGKAQTVAGGLGTGDRAGVFSVSCTSAGNCSAGGSYVRSSFHAFVINETNGTWGKAARVAGPRWPGQINSVSCASAGNCSAGGYPNAPLEPAFVVNETNGTWGKATSVARNLGSAQINSVSCASAGNCTAGGYYLDTFDAQRAFVVGETNGTWGKAMQVVAGRNTGGAEINSVSCGSPGNCSAGGIYHGVLGGHAFVINETNGIWGKVINAAANLHAAQINSVSCASAGNCTAGGNYFMSTRSFAFVVSEVNGTWEKGRKVAGALGPGQTNSVSCASAGNCSAGGYYADSSFNQQAFVVNETNGTWGKAMEVTAALNTGGEAEIDSVSCAPARTCSAGGDFDNSAGQEAFVVSKP